MNKIMAFVMPAKSLAALIFSGLMVLYVIAGYIVPAIQGASFGYTVPFIFVIEGVVLSIVIAAAWQALFADSRRWRFLPRLAVFCLVLVVLLALSVLVFFGWHTDWAKLWWIVVAAIMAGIVIVAIVGELYYRATGQRYTQLLRDYQATTTQTPPEPGAPQS